MKQQLDGLLARLQVISRSAVTIIGVATTIASVALTEVVPHLPAPLAGTVTEWVVRAIVVLTGVVAVIRRVTPVTKDLRGLLAKDNGPALDQPVVGEGVDVDVVVADGANEHTAAEQPVVEDLELPDV